MNATNREPEDLTIEVTMSAERVDAEHILYVGGRPDDTLHTATIEHDGIAVFGTGLTAEVALADALISLGTELLKRSAER